MIALPRPGLRYVLAALFSLVVTVPAPAREYHVSPRGDDANDGVAGKMLKTVSAAAQRARPGDVVTVHEGVYRERVNPPRGGSSDAKRIVYQAAPGERVVIKGSEVVKGWEKVQGDTWKVTLPDSFFGAFNPFRDRIRGDWFNGKGRVHHTGAVYLNGHWLTEAARLDDVLKPTGENPLWFTDDGAGGAGAYLMNVAWIKPGQAGGTAGRIPAERFAANRGIKTAPCSEGGKCIGWIEDGDWATYEKVDFGSGMESVEIRAASVTGGGRIELRLDKPDGELLGSCAVADTGDWQKWRSFKAAIKPTSGPKKLCLMFRPQGTGDKTGTTIWAQFKGTDPNVSDVEINVRQSVFYPEKPGMNYITVRGFIMEHAATPWAPPTAEQVGLIGTHWSKGWIIENNTVRYSTCVGITLGKHGDEFDNTSANSAEGYVKTIERGVAHGWSKENIGHHIVRDNHISHCEQAGIVGSLGPVFSTVTGNEIHDIHIRRLFTGAEMGGIKFHAAIDALISGNHIYRTCRGIWLDWMTHGTRVTRNLLHDNGPSEDLFLEVNHGPCLVENNLLLSRISLLVNSQGAAYAHNVIAGNVRVLVGERRKTPYQKAHSTVVAGLQGNLSGDERYYNNLVTGGGLHGYDRAKLPVFMEGNVFLKGAKPCKHEPGPLVAAEFDLAFKVVTKGDGVYLEMNCDSNWATRRRPLVTTDLLGKAKIPNLPYEQADGSPYRLDTDYLGKKRNAANPFPGPFEWTKSGKQTLKVWPLRP